MRARLRDGELGYFIGLPSKVAVQRVIRTPSRNRLDVREEREVYIAPPANAWRHLRKLPKDFAEIPVDQEHLYVLECATPVPGLMDAPLLWQAALTLYIKDHVAGKRALLDETCFA
eukprot:7267149-Pyramimonas_sp.AAC.1